jgi:transposase
MMIGFFEGIDSERGIAWRLADSLTLRQFLSIGLDGGLVKGKTIGADSTTLQANAAMKSIVRRDTGESYSGYLEVAGGGRNGSD